MGGYPRNDAREGTPVKLLKLVVLWICLLGIPILGETTVLSLGRRLGWSDQARFASEAVFWSLWCMALATWLVSTFRRDLALGARRGDAIETSRPLLRHQYAFIVVGMYLTMFLWLICLAWREHDRATAGMVTGAMLVMGLWNYLQLRGKTGADAIRGAYIHMTLSCAVVAAVINLRLDVWVAAADRVSVAEAHNLFPFWMVPTLTLAVGLWTAVVMALTGKRPTTLPA